jgi:hypothetical protein
MSLEIYRALLKEYGKSSACESEKTPALLQQPEVQDGKFSLPKALLGFLSCAFRSGLFSSCRTAHDPFWEFLGSRFTVPFLKSLVRDLSLNQKLRKLSPLGFALKGHHSSSMTNGLYPAQARGKSCAVSRGNYVFASSKTQDRCEKRKDTRESQYNRSRKWDAFSAPYKRLRRPDATPSVVLWAFS